MTTMTTRKRRAMTLIDPDTRWWRTNRTRSLLAYLCIGLGLVAGFLGPLAIFNTDLDDSSWTPKWLAAGYITVAIPLIIAGTLIYGFGVDGDAKPRPVTWALPLYFIVTGAGCLIGAHWSGLAFGSAQVVFILFIAAGVVCAGAIEARRYRNREARGLRERVERDGVTVNGVVTRAKSYVRGEVPVTRVTVRFTDTDGKSRWVRQTVTGIFEEGARLTVCYLPRDLGHNAGVIVCGR